MIDTGLPVSTHHRRLFFSIKKVHLKSHKKQKSSSIFTDDSVHLFKNTENAHELIAGFGLFLKAWHRVCGVLRWPFVFGAAAGRQGVGAR